MIVAGLQPRNTRHHHIQDHQVRIVRQEPDALQPVFRLSDGVALAFLVPRIDRRVDLDHVHGRAAAGGDLPVLGGDIAAGEGEGQFKIGVSVLAVITWLTVIFFDRELLLAFGAEESLLPLAQQYVFPVKFAVPSFLFPQLMAAFLRNDGDPGRATKAVIFGGVFNVFGDYFFVFTLDMGIMGAGLATVLGSVFSLIIMLTHFHSPKNTIRLEKPDKIFSMLKAISVTGFSRQSANCEKQQTEHKTERQLYCVSPSNGC